MELISCPKATLFRILFFLSLIKTGRLLSIVFAFVNNMICPSNNKKKNTIAISAAAAAIFFMLGIIVVSNIVTPIAATTTGNTMNGATATMSSGLALSPQPIMQETGKDESQIPINQTHMQITFSGNGTFNLPNSTEAVRTTSSGSGILALREGAFAGKVIFTTEDRSENATATAYEIVRFNMQNGTGSGIAIVVFHTDSIGKLAPLDGMIMVGQDEFRPDGSYSLTFWEWHSGVPYVKMPAPMQWLLMDTTNEQSSPTVVE